MARRKPQHVVRNRQQNVRQRDAAQNSSASDDAAGEDASNEPSDVIIIDDSDDIQDGEVEEEEAPPTKRRRGFFLRRGWTEFMDASDLDLCVGAPSQLWDDNAPWSDAKRVDALWLSIPTAAIPSLDEKIRALEAEGAFGACQAVECIGLVACGEWCTASTNPMRIALRDVYDGWGWGRKLLEPDLVTVEVERTHNSDGHATFVCRVGVDWQKCMNTPAFGLEPFMSWLLYHSKAAGVQYHYAYPKEIDAMHKGHSTAFDVHDVYARIDVKRQLARDVSNIPAHVTATDSVLLPTLRDYQKAALSWMLAREGVQSERMDEEDSSVDPLPCLTRCVHFPWPSEARSTNTTAAAGGKELLYDIFSGTFRMTAGVDDGERLVTNLDAIRGGILAEEMGLGKTVEVIALVLSNPSPETLPMVLTDAVESENAADESGFVRGCICGSEDECDPGWVQCDLCNVWHHRLCTGFDPDGAPSFIVLRESSLVQDSFVCFHCQIEQHVMLSCKTTLIVSPESIHDQWESELKRHVKPGTLKLLRYPGVKALRSRLQGKGPSAEWRILSSLGVEMATYDIVLTTYEALAFDLHHIPTSIGKERRSSTRQKRKKYAFIGSPLVFLKFWRVCMDEAQVGVENTQLQAALTVAELRTEMKWVVTGTPFSTQLMDIYGCFAFLQVAPYCDEDSGKSTFQSEIESFFSCGATDRLYDLLLWNGHTPRSGGGLLWRTNKRDVLDQLGLPAQSEELIWCRFSNVEQHFYNNQEAEVIKALQSERQRRRHQLGADYVNEEDEVGENVWHRVLLLRQVCCHPQVGQILRTIGGTDGRDRRRAGRGSQNGGPVSARTRGGRPGMNVLTMDDFLLQLLERCRRECEEAQRKLIAAHNGHASLVLISDDFSTAIIKYMLSVQLIRSNWDEFRADLLPRLHILDNLAASIRRLFKLDTTIDLDEQGSEPSLAAMANQAQNGAIITLDGSDGDAAELMADEEANPKKVSLMPDLPVLLRTITDNGIVTVGVDIQAISKECATLEAAARKIRRFYLLEGEQKHSVALHQFETIQDAVDAKLPEQRPTSRGAGRARAGDDGMMLCSSSLWWFEMFAFLKQLSERKDHVVHMVHRLRAHLYAVGTPWSTSFAERFHDTDGLALALVSELTTLRNKRTAVMEKLLSQSRREPTKMEIQISGNCKKCRDAGDGPVCWHCKFYKEFEGYKQHVLGIDNTVATATALTSWTGDLLATDEDEVEEGEGENAASSTTTASTSLIVDIFRQLSSGARLLLRENRSLFSPAERDRLTQVFQDGVQQEAELWADILREWNRGKKLFQVQHQRLGSLDELEMAQMKIRLRLPGEVVETAVDKLYKLEAYQLPDKLVSFDVERVVAEAELKNKQSELRYLRHLQTAKTDGNGANNENRDAAATENGEKACVVCLEDISKQKVAMLPCAHKTCIKCSEKLVRARSIRCPTCRRLFRADERKEVDNDVNRAKERALAAQMANSRVVVADSSVQLMQGGFSSKIDAILRRVRALASNQPDLKALVFTQWQDMMGVIAAALQLNGIKCFTYTSKKQFHRVLQEFKLFPDACVLALPFKIGANGLNIIEATEVLLVEPLLNTSIEAQAINRVHRIGQTKPTRVHRFIVDNSIEERIYWLGRSKQTIRRDHDETETKDEDDAEAMEIDDSVVVGRQEKEKLTLGQLEALLNGRAMVANGDALADGLAGTNASDHPFWQQRVVLDGRVVTRREARELLERRNAAERRAAQAATASKVPVTLLVDRNVSLVVAHELLQLKICGEEDGVSYDGLKELVAMAKQRIHEEVRVWQASKSSSSPQSIDVSHE